MKTKTFNITYQYSMIGTVSIAVPNNMSIDEAIQYAKDKVNELPLPQNAQYVGDSCIVDEENCDFSEE